MCLTELNLSSIYIWNFHCLADCFFLCRRADFELDHEKLHSFITKFHYIKLVYEGHEQFRNTKFSKLGPYLNTDPKFTFISARM